MSAELIITLSLLLSAATIIQSLTGFGFGLFVIASVTLFTAIPVSTTAFLISALSLVNAAELAIRQRQHIHRRMVVWVLALGLPAIGLGFWLLEWLSGQNRQMLMLILGVCIIVCSALLLIKRKGLNRESRGWQFGVAGAIGGILGGLFSTFGPPVIFQCYRQPWTIEQVRATLLAIFSISAIARLAMVPFGTIPDTATLWYTLAAIPLVMLSTRFARYLATFIAASHIRTMAIIMLFASGISLILKAL
ncbi:sulfite exporter TauE/SafE family protein [Alteromonas halophila]|uniref:Probable membrane transporter protein n=1 Tax=Alteromonas halophila TaxID=516698 RepID=A0A918JGI3_9ALTE|nr:sulfite exporter TauE/SafE family protein [Alteromonas halophila]GGW78097.1 membrane protein [Alteromonas halophila]